MHLQEGTEETIEIDIRVNDRSVPDREATRVAPYTAFVVMRGRTLNVRVPTCGCHDGRIHELPLDGLSEQLNPDELREMIQEFVYDAAQGHPIHERKAA